MKRILITGGCGFIGLNLVEYLIHETDWNINILDNLSNGRYEDLEKINIPNGRISFFKGDVRNYEDVEKSIRETDYVVHLAAQTSVLESINDPIKDEQINIKGTVNLLHLAKLEKIKKFVFVSSAAALGPQDVPINELKTPNPISFYGLSKLTGENYCRIYSKIHNLRCIVLRFSNVYGPKSYLKGSVIPKFIKKIMNKENLEIYGNGEQTRDFVFVKDICYGIYQCLIKSFNSFEIIQLGTGIETTINSLVKNLLNIIRKSDFDTPKIIHSEPQVSEVYRNFTDISYAKKKLDYYIRYDLKKGLEETFNWFKEEF
ncbi:MAG: NAD-dependent epimerase/dehydratase family protein [Promethearchaeota archaeon]